MTRFEVRLDAESSGFRVFDTALDKNVDGPFRTQEEAEARAAKREGRDAFAEGQATEQGVPVEQVTAAEAAAGTSVPPEEQETAPAEEG